MCERGRERRVESSPELCVARKTPYAVIAFEEPKCHNADHRIYRKKMQVRVKILVRYFREDKIESEYQSEKIRNKDSEQIVSHEKCRYLMPMFYMKFSFHFIFLIHRRGLLGAKIYR